MRRAVILLALACAACAHSADRDIWDARYAREGYLYGKEPVPFLRERLALLPRGRALDLAAGEGRNAVFLAENGFRVTAVDVSPVGLAKARALAAERGVEIETIAADLKHYDLGEGLYEVVANFYYLDRELTPAIKRALKPGGVVIYETSTVEELQIRTPSRRGEEPEEEYLLRPGELKAMFSDFEILYYAETKDGTKAVASLAARKPRGP